MRVTDTPQMISLLAMAFPVLSPTHMSAAAMRVGSVAVFGQHAILL